MGSPDSTDSSVNTSSSSVAISPPPKKRFDGPSSSNHSMRSSGGGGGKGKTTYPSSSSHLNGSTTSSSSAHRQRNAKEESYGECSNAMEVDGEDTLKLSKTDFPEYNIRHGWQSPTYKVNKGKVQPRVIPPPGKPTKHTNVLEFLWKKVVKMLMKHQHGWPFATPVDTISLPIGNYHEIIKRPMDLTTVENRIKHQYYVCGAECIRDIEQIFENCFLYNPPEYPHYFLGKLLHSVFTTLMASTPTDEFEMVLKGGYVSRIKKDVVPRGSVLRSPSPASIKETDAVLKYLHNATVQGAVNRTESNISTNGLPDDRKRAGDPIIAPLSEKRPRIRNRPMPNYSAMTPKWKGKYTPRMQGCVKIVSDFLTKKSHRLYANPFVTPVDVEAYQLLDYYDVIKKPMDLSSIKKQLDHKLYANVEEFRDDMLLMFQNCFKFNRSGDMVHTAGLQLLEAFDEKFAKLPPDTATTKTPKIRPTSSADNSMASLNTTMPSFNASALFAAAPPTPAMPALEPASYLTSFMETPKLAPNTLSMPAPALPTGPIYEACDDDEMIQALMLRIQMQNLVYTEKMSIMQRLSQDLLTLQMHRIAARATNCAAVQPPILSSEAVTRIMHIFEPAQCMPIPIPVLSQAQLDELRSKGLKVGAVPRTVNMPRVIGETPGPSNVAPSTVPPQPTPASRAPSRASSGSARKSTAPPPPTRRAVLSSSDSEYDSASVMAKRRKKKTKSPKKESRVDYTFKSDDESVHAPLSYDEKRVVSMNVQSISPDAVPEILRIIEQRERIPELDYAEEIDFDNLKPVTLRELNALATSMLLSRGQKVYTFGAEAEKEEPPKDSKDGVKTSQPAVKTEAPSASTVFNGFEKKVEPAPSSTSPPKTTTAANPRAELDELKLSSSDSSDSSDSDDSSSSSDSDSDSDESDSEPEKKVTEDKFNASSVKAPIANGVSNTVNGKSAEPEAKPPKVSPQNSSSTCSPVNVNGFSANKGQETPRQMNGKPPMSKPSASSKPASSLACDPLSLLDQPTAPKIEKPFTASFKAPSTPPRNNYRHLDRVDLSSQISLMANFEENF